MQPQPIIIGGLGGSGTRVVCSILQACGYDMGTDLNTSLDNLSFTYLFKEANFQAEPSENIQNKLKVFTKLSTSNRPEWDQAELSLLQSCLRERALHPDKWTSKRYNEFLSKKTTARVSTLWGWKEPNTHIYLDELLNFFPQCKYIHVSRNGLDMAYSNNQNQLQLWGELVLGRKITGDAKDAFDYWYRVDKTIRNQSKLKPESIFMLNFDEMCNTPDTIIAELMVFLQKDTIDIVPLIQMIEKPSTIGRYESHDNSFLSAEQSNYLRINNFIL